MNAKPVVLLVALVTIVLAILMASPELADAKMMQEAMTTVI